MEDKPIPNATPIRTPVGETFLKNIAEMADKLGGLNEAPGGITNTTRQLDLETEYLTPGQAKEIQEAQEAQTIERIPQENIDQKSAPSGGKSEINLSALAQPAVKAVSKSPAQHPSAPLAPIQEQNNTPHKREHDPSLEGIHKKPHTAQSSADKLAALAQRTVDNTVRRRNNAPSSKPANSQGVKR